MWTYHNMKKKYIQLFQFLLYGLEKFISVCRFQFLRRIIIGKKCLLHCINIIIDDSWEKKTFSHSIHWHFEIFITILTCFSSINLKLWFIKTKKRNLFQIRCAFFLVLHPIIQILHVVMIIIALNLNHHHHETASDPFGNKKFTFVYQATYFHPKDAFFGEEKRTFYVWSCS